MKIAAIAGSLRRGSLNRGVIEAVGELLPADVELNPLDIRLPLYDADLDVDGGPPEVAAFKQAIAEADGVFIATPEYNYGIPGPLKNALDWASRPAYRSVFAGKSVAIAGASRSVVGTARAQSHLKGVLLGMVAEVFPYPEIIIGAAASKFEDGRLTDPATREHLQTMLTAWTERLRR